MTRFELRNFQLMTENGVLSEAIAVIEDGIVTDLSHVAQARPASTKSISSEPIAAPSQTTASKKTGPLKATTSENILASRAAVSDDGSVIDCGGGILVPGMIDVHIHGANGFDMMDGTVESIQQVSAFLAKTGCTGFLATSVTSSLDSLNGFIDNVKAVVGKEPGAKILGLHLEGPYLNPAYKGMQNEAFLRHPDLDEMEAILKRADGLVKMVTVAPELPGGMELVSYLKQHGIVVSIAHSDAKYDEAKQAFGLGASHVTHCFNAMRPIHHREPGVVIAAFEEEHVSCQAIVDNIHLHPAIIRFMHRNLGPARMVLVTDAMQAMGMADGKYQFGGHDVQVVKGVARLTDGTLASSTITMDKTLRTAVLDDIPLSDAIYMTSTTPASILGLTNAGFLAAGIPADVALFDKELTLQWTMVNGCIHSPH